VETFWGSKYLVGVFILPLRHLLPRDILAALLSIFSKTYFAPSRFKYHNARTYYTHSMYICWWCRVALPIFPVCDLPMIKAALLLLLLLRQSIFSRTLSRPSINEEVKYCTLLHLYQPQKFTPFEKYTRCGSLLFVRRRAPKMQTNSSRMPVSDFQYFPHLATSISLLH